MKNNILIIFILAVTLLTACADKNKQGTITYDLAYQLPDSLLAYGPYLPKTATVHFKDDSVVSIQGIPEENTTIITHQPTNYMLVLLKSAAKSYQVIFNKDEQKQEVPDISMYTFTKSGDTKMIAGYNAEHYIMKNKATGIGSDAWFTHDIKIPPSSLTMMFDAKLGVPLSFKIDQNGFVTHTTVKEIKFEQTPDGAFSTPPGYQKLTPQQLKDMPVGE